MVQRRTRRGRTVSLLRIHAPTRWLLGSRRAGQEANEDENGADAPVTLGCEKQREMQIPRLQGRHQGPRAPSAEAVFLFSGTFALAKRKVGRRAAARVVQSPGLSTIRGVQDPLRNVSPGKRYLKYHWRKLLQKKNTHTRGENRSKSSI